MLVVTTNNMMEKENEIKSCDAFASGKKKGLSSANVMILSSKHI